MRKRSGDLFGERRSGGRVADHGEIAPREGGSSEGIHGNMQTESGRKRDVGGSEMEEARLAKNLSLLRTDDGRSTCSGCECCLDDNARLMQHELIGRDCAVLHCVCPAKDLRPSMPCCMLYSVQEGREGCSR
eukprot:764936-Hanusia_phi.AAC.4